MKKSFKKFFIVTSILQSSNDNLWKLTLEGFSAIKLKLNNSD